MLSRKAILIACDPQHNLTQITDDIRECYNFLRSPFGGGWCKNEISILICDDATVSRVKFEISEADDICDYLFLMFSGHGGMFFPSEEDNVLSSQTILRLNDNCLLEKYLYSLSSRCQRKTILLDCCRNFCQISPGTYEFASGITETDQAHELFSWLFSRSDPGVVKMYATQPGQCALDNPSFFSFLQKGVEYCQKELLEQNRLFHSTFDVFQCAQCIMKECNYEQKPSYICNPLSVESGQGRQDRLCFLEFPFIVNPYIRLK